MPDLAAAEARLNGARERDPRRPGVRRPRLHGGRPCLACGVRLPHAHALGGHSDADVGLHALADAIYGALARGRHRGAFPALRPAMEGRGFAPLSRPRGRAGADPRRRHRPPRRDADVRGAQDRPAPGGDARELAEIAGLDLAGVGQGDHYRADGVHRPARRNRLPRDGDPPAAVTPRPSGAKRGFLTELQSFQGLMRSPGPN